ncbi:hypothetical protein BC832DRAFT_595439 [Gaertneriomyces semiglobifer]|nr:hypothetical protein BC832DRAFT_595439 [Gaertneriomyces semiglobifer]
MADHTSIAIRGLSLRHDSNGPGSTGPASRIVGRFQLLKTVSAGSPYLCQYLEAQKSAKGQLYVVSEHHSSSLQSHASQQADLAVRDVHQLRQWTYQIASALSYLSSYGIHHGNLCTANILLHPTLSIRLAHYGLCFLTGGGIDAQELTRRPELLPPELIRGVSGVDEEKTDVWMLGMTLVELYFGAQALVIQDPQEMHGFLLSLLLHAESGRNSSTEAEVPWVVRSMIDTDEDLDPSLAEFLRDCLNPDPATRPRVADLLAHRFLQTATSPDLSLQASILEDPLTDLTLPQLFHLWKVDGGNIENEYNKSTQHFAPSINRLPYLVRLAQDPFKSATSHMQSDLLVQVPLEPVIRKLVHAPKVRWRPAYGNESWKSPPNWTSRHDFEMLPDSVKLHTISKEKDVLYQYYRIRLFIQLLRNYPETKEEIMLEAVTDIPPILRGLVWAAVLDGDELQTAQDMDEVVDDNLDRQLALDIPRCHQYNELLSSPTGHSKLKRLLRSWAAMEADCYVYWQGLDSVCAAPLSLNFADETLALETMRAFLRRFSGGFFVQDNSTIMHETMITFSQLIAFHDPLLSEHMRKCGLEPHLFALPWFMTMYSHIFPLDKIYVLWDNIIIGPRFLFLFIGCAILHQLRDDLLPRDFNMAMLLFSDLGAIDIERCVVHAHSLYRVTPPSVVEHLYDIFDTHVVRLPIELRQKELLPSISMEDYRVMEPFSTTFDTRKPSAYHAGHIPFSQDVQPDAVDPQFYRQIVNTRMISGRNKYIVVILDEKRSGSEFAKKLLWTGQLPHICLLQAHELQLELITPFLCECQPNRDMYGLHRCRQST